MLHWHYLAWAAAAVCFGVALLGVFAAGMASRETTAEDFSLPKRAALIGAGLVALTLVL